MPRLLPILALALGLAAPLTGCQPAEPAESAPAAADAPAATADPTAIRAEIEALTAAYQAADRAGNHAAMAALYADDAVIHPANMPAAQGRAALDAYFAANDAEPQDITFTTVDVVASDAGDMAYEVGITETPDGASKYVTIYRRTADGWKIVADSWSDNAPPAATN